MSTTPRRYKLVDRNISRVIEGHRYLKFTFWAKIFKNQKFMKLHQRGCVEHIISVILSYHEAETDQSNPRNLFFQKLSGSGPLLYIRSPKSTVAHLNVERERDDGVKFPVSTTTFHD